MKNHFVRVFFVMIAISFFAGCSVKYDETPKADSSNPEFVFSGAVYTKYEKQKLKAMLSADSIEKYRNSSAIYASSVNFESYDETQAAQTKGFCGYLYANPDSKIYELFDDIQIDSTVYKAKFSADSLKFDGNTEQLTGSKNDTVKIEKDDTVIYGTGFSASSVSDSFSFSGTVTGEIYTDGENQPDGNLSEGNNQ